MHKTYFSLLSGLLICLNVAGQTNVIDSLKTALSKSEDPKEQIQLNYDLYAAYLYQDPDISRQFVDAGMKISQEINYDRGIVLGYDKYGGLEMVISNYPKALQYFLLADSMLQSMDWSREKAVIYGNISAIYKDLAQYDSSLVWNQKFIDLAREINNKGFEAFGLSLVGDIHYQKGQNELAARNYFQSLRIYEKLGDKTRLADAFRLLGAAQSGFKSHEEAFKNLTEAAKIYQELDDNIYLGQTYRDIAKDFFIQEDFDQAEAYYLKAEEISASINDPFGAVSVIAALGEVANEKGEYAKAMELAEKSIELYQERGSTLEVGISYLLVGKVFNNLKQYQQALPALKKALEYLSDIDAATSLQIVFLELANAYQGLNQPSSSLDAYQNYSEIRDSIFTVEKAIRMEELQVIYNIEKKDQEIALLSKDVSIGQLRRQLLSFGLIGSVAVAGLIILNLITRRRKERKIEEERHLRQQSELEKSQLEKDQLERELTSQVLQLCKKNELLASVQEEVKLLSEGGQQKDNNNLRRLNRTIDRSLQSDDDWSQFLATFEKVHPRFLTQLRKQVEKLSPAEQRLACLFRMNLSSKEIATMLNISDEGVKKARYRLRKKMGLSSEINLQNYLINLPTNPSASS